MDSPTSTPANANALEYACREGRFHVEFLPRSTFAGRFHKGHDRHRRLAFCVPTPDDDIRCDQCNVRIQSSWCLVVPCVHGAQMAVVLEGRSDVAGLHASGLWKDSSGGVLR